MKRYVATGAVARLNRLVCHCDPHPGVEADKDQARCRGDRPMTLPAVTMLSTGLARQLPTSARIVTGIDPYNESVVMFDSRMFPQPRGCPPNYQPRDTIGQQPTDHAWVNHGAETCRALFVRMDLNRAASSASDPLLVGAPITNWTGTGFPVLRRPGNAYSRTHCGQIFAEAVFGGPALGPAMLSKRPQ